MNKLLKRRCLGIFYNKNLLIFFGKGRKNNENRVQIDKNAPKLYKMYKINIKNGAKFSEIHI